MRLSSLLARATSSCTLPVRSPSLFLASSICKPQGVTLLRKHQAYLCYFCCKAVTMLRRADKGAASMHNHLRDCPARRMPKGALVARWYAWADVVSAASS